MSCVAKSLPKLNEECYETWKKDVLIWSELTDLPKNKQALALHLSLEGKARAASSQITLADLKKEDGLQDVIKKLDELFLLEV